MAPAKQTEVSLIHCRLDELLDQRAMTLTDLSRAVGVTLAAICQVLKCEVGDLLVIDANGSPAGAPVTANAGK